MTRRLSHPPRRFAGPDSPAQASIRARPNDGPAAVASSLLASNLPQHPVEGVRDPEGFAFTAVSPFYKEWTWSTRSVIGFSPVPLEDHPQFRLILMIGLVRGLT